MATASSEKKPQYKIRQVATRLDIAVETIRMCEREGLLLVHKTATGQRLFDESDVHWISTAFAASSKKKASTSKAFAGFWH